MREAASRNAEGCSGELTALCALPVPLSHKAIIPLTQLHSWFVCLGFLVLGLFVCFGLLFFLNQVLPHGILLLR